jgi:hypothetical protein
MVASLLLTGALVANKTITRCFLAPCDSFATSVCFGLSFSVRIAVDAEDCGSFCCNCHTLLVGGYLTPGAPARSLYMCGPPRLCSNMSTQCALLAAGVGASAVFLVLLRGYLCVHLWFDCCCDYVWVQLLRNRRRRKVGYCSDPLPYYA